MAAQAWPGDGKKIVPDAWDSYGRPAVRSQTGGWTRALTILVVELLERMTTLSIAVNLVPYLTRTMRMGNASAANTVTNFLGTSFMLSLLGGLVADTFLGRHLTIALSTLVQTTGVALLTASTAAPALRPLPCGDGPSCGGATAWQMGVLYLALYTTALGTGGLKSSVSGFGSDQFDESDPSEGKRMASFFGWFFFLITLGALLAVTVLVYLQDHAGRRWGYGVCAVAILSGLLVFLSGTRGYRFKKPSGSPVTQIAAVVVASWRKRHLEIPSDLVFHTQQLRALHRAAIVTGAGAGAGRWELSTVTEVEEVKMVVRMLPTWATTIAFWTVYAQMTTFSVAQATAMDRRLGGSFTIPAGSLTVFFVGSVLLTVPFYDRVVVPALRRWRGSPHGLTPLQCIGVGLALSIIAMVAAALTEIKRLHSVHAGAALLRVFWLVPQFVTVGAGVAFMYMGQLDFFLRECPKGMKTMSTGMFLSTISLGFFLSSALVSAVHAVTGRGAGAWLPDDLDKGKLFDFYWLLAGISTLNIGVYLAGARSYVYKGERAVGAGEEWVKMEAVAGQGQVHACE